MFLVYEACRSLPAAAKVLRTPLESHTGVEICDPPLLVPVLRAGLGMLDAAQQLLPNASVGFVGAKRNEQTLLPDFYVNTVPDDLGGRAALVLEPMLATGGSLSHSCGLLEESNAGSITIVSLIAALEGVEAFRSTGIDAEIFLACVDSHLNDYGFIVPGLGDAGDRQFNEAEPTG